MPALRRFSPFWVIGIRSLFRSSGLLHSSRAAASKFFVRRISVVCLNIVVFEPMMPPGIACLS